MMKVTSKGKFNIAFGTAFVIENPPHIKVGDVVMVDDSEYTVKRIIMPTRPGIDDLTIFV